LCPRKIDYDPCEGTIGKGKTNAELADITKKNIESSEYWRDLDAFITIFESTLAALRVNDGDVPPIGETYFRMSKIKAEIDTNEWTLDGGNGEQFSLLDDEKASIVAAFDARWEMMHNELHSCAFVLNPLLHDHHKFDGDCMYELKQYIERYFGDDELKIQRFLEQLDNFRDKTGEFSEDRGKAWTTLLRGEYALPPAKWFN